MRTTTKFEPPTLPVELYAEALERAETALSALKGIPAPVYPAPALKAIEDVLAAVHDLNHARLTLENAEAIQREADL